MLTWLPSVNSSRVMHRLQHQPRAKVLQSGSALVDHPECLLHSMTIRYDGIVDGSTLSSLVDVVGRNSTLHTLKISSVIDQGLEAQVVPQWPTNWVR
jgi:hypothetical protein